MASNSKQRAGGGRAERSASEDGGISLVRRSLLRSAALGAGAYGLARRGRARQTSDFVDVLSADPSDYPEILVSVSVDTSAGRAGDLTESDFRITEREVRKAISAFSYTSTSADVVFVFDDTGSMYEEIDDMKTQVRELTGDIETAGIDARYALVTFKDTVETDLSFTGDAGRLKRAVDDLDAAGGGDEPEDDLDAIAQALGLDFRTDAQKVLVDITDSVAHYRGDGDGVTRRTLEDVATTLRQSGVAYIAVAPDIDNPQTSKKTLAAQTDGLWIDIHDAEFGRILRRIERLVTTAYVLRYTTDLDPGERGAMTVRVEDPDGGVGRDETTVDVPVDAGDASGDQRFRPTVNGFGFCNCGTSLADCGCPDSWRDHAHESISLEEATRVVTDDWTPELEDALGAVTSLFQDLLARILYLEINDDTATDGHCVGMAYAARHYYRNPSEIPVDARTAAEVTNVAAGDGSVGDDIDFYHNTQLADLENFARYLQLNAGMVDLSSAMDELDANLGRNSPVPVFLTGAGNHAALAYDIEHDGNDTTVSLYDPNYEATEYETRETTFEVNRAGGSTTVTDELRTTFGALDVLVPTTRSPDAETLGLLFGGVVSFELGSPATLSVRGPDGQRLSRLRPDITESEVLHRFGAQSGEYDVTVEGTDAGTYTLEIISAADGQVVDLSRTASETAPGETDEFTVTRDDDGSMSITRQPSERRTFRIMSTDEDAEVSYRFTVDGDAEKTRIGDDGPAADDEETIEDNDDGTVTVTGSTGQGFGDAFIVIGEITDFEKTGGESGLRLYLDGEEVTDRFLPEESTFRVMSTDEDAEVSYRFTVDGDAEKTRIGDDGPAADDEETIEDNDDGTVTVTGSTGQGFGDAFIVTGEITDFEKTGGESGLRLYLDGEEVTDELLDEGS